MTMSILLILSTEFLIRQHLRHNIDPTYPFEWTSRLHCHSKSHAQSYFTQTHKKHMDRQTDRHAKWEEQYNVMIRFDTLSIIHPCSCLHVLLRSNTTIKNKIVSTTSCISYYIIWYALHHWSVDSRSSFPFYLSTREYFVNYIDAHIPRLRTMRTSRSSIVDLVVAAPAEISNNSSTSTRGNVLVTVLVGNSNSISNTSISSISNSNSISNSCRTWFQSNLSHTIFNFFLFLF